MSNARVHESLLRETARQYHVKLTGTVLTCSACVQAKDRRASAPTATSSWMAEPLQCVLFDLGAPRKSLLQRRALFLVLFKHDTTCTGWLYPFKSKSAIDVAAATTKFPADVGDAVKCFRADNGVEFVNETFVRTFSGNTTRHDHTEFDRPKLNGVVERELGLIQEGGMTACLEAPRLFPRQLPDID